jgi:hypothetical protein
MTAEAFKAQPCLRPSTIVVSRLSYSPIGRTQGACVPVGWGLRRSGVSSAVHALQPTLHPDAVGSFPQSAAAASLSLRSYGESAGLARGAPFGKLKRIGRARKLRRSTVLTGFQLRCDLSGERNHTGKPACCQQLSAGPSLGIPWTSDEMHLT